MNRETEITPVKTYKTKENARKAVAQKGLEAFRHFMMIEEKTGRWFPVFIGQEAAQNGIHFHFNIVG